MAELKAFFIVAIVYLSAVSGDEVEVKPQAIVPFPPGPITAYANNTTKDTTTEKPSTSTTKIPVTSPSPAPTEKPKTTTTTKPPTTTASPTVSPNTTTAPNTTTITPPTTTAPSNTTTSAPTTTAKPTPTPAPSAGHWIANYTSTNRTCLVFNAAIQIDIPYKVGNQSKLYKINVPKDAQSMGKCLDKENDVHLWWGSPVNNITFYFTKKVNDSSRFELSDILVAVNVTLPDDKGPRIRQFNHTKDEFVTPVTRSYKCAQEQAFNLTGTGVEATLILSHLQVQAFRNATNTNFDDALDCINGETPDVVPIAVGCALAALVIIVLVAYLIGRRRSQARGYLSM